MKDITQSLSQNCWNFSTTCIISVCHWSKPSSVWARRPKFLPYTLQWLGLGMTIRLLMKMRISWWLDLLIWTPMLELTLSNCKHPAMKTMHPMMRWCGNCLIANSHWSGSSLILSIIEDACICGHVYFNETSHFSNPLVLVFFSLLWLSVVPMQMCAFYSDIINHQPSTITLSGTHSWYPSISGVWSHFRRKHTGCPSPLHMWLWMQCKQWGQTRFTQPLSLASKRIRGMNWGPWLFIFTCMGPYYILRFSIFPNDMDIWSLALFVNTK